MKICPKCNYHRKASDQASDWQCPSCGIAYAKFMQAQAANNTPRPLARPVSVPREASRSNVKMYLVGGMFLVLVAIAFWKMKHQVHVTPEMANASQFDAAKKAFDNDHYGVAMKGFTPLAEAGNAKAQYYMGLIYRYTWSDDFGGDGTRHPADPKMQIQWFTKAAEQGDIPSQLALGDVYDHGYGENADRGPGTHWYQLAADADDAAGQFHLGLAYENATGVPKDEAQAAVWYRKAAKQGYVEALYKLGVIYSWGRGVGKSNLIAYEYMGLTEAMGKSVETGAPIMTGNDKEALRKQLSELEIEKGNEFVKNWSIGMPLPD